MTFISRAAWGARPPTSTGNAISAHPLGVVVHYSEGNLGSSPDSECDDTVRGIQRYHMDTKGWADIAYSFLVCPHGNVFEGRGTGKGSAANGTTQANLDYYAVCALGGPKDTPSLSMITGIGLAIGSCRMAGAGALVIGHRDLIPTACPGAGLYAYVQAARWTGVGPFPPAPSQAASPFPTTTLEETDMPLTIADADLVVKRLLGTALGDSGMVVAKALQSAAVAPAAVDIAALAAAIVAALPAGGSNVTAADIAKAVADEQYRRQES